MSNPKPQTLAYGRTAADDNVPILVEPDGTVVTSGGGGGGSTVVVTGDSPTLATVGIASAQAVAANANRKGLLLTNTSSNFISLGFGHAAVLYSGLTLTPYGVLELQPGMICQQAIFAIASGASSNLGVQEFE